MRLTWRTSSAAFRNGGSNCASLSSVTNSSKPALLPLVFPHPGNAAGLHSPR